jgi:hypothetical protein
MPHMAKGKTAPEVRAPDWFAEAVSERERERHPRLFIRRMLEEEANRAPCVDGSDEARAWAALKQWADLADRGDLLRKETSLDADFLEKIFGDALGYRSFTENPADFHRDRQFSVPGGGTADGALGKFSSDAEMRPMAIIELKGGETDLDRDKSSGRTPVQQLWDYLNQLPDCPWGILSNYVSIRLYHRAAGPRRRCMRSAPAHLQPSKSGRGAWCWSAACRAAGKPRWRCNG